MSGVRTDVGPRAPISLPDTGLTRGWESPALIAVTLVLLSFGLVNLYSASTFLAQQYDLPDSFFVLRQAAGGAIGLFALLVCSRVPYGVWRKLAWPMIWGSLFALLLLILPFTHGIAPETNGARRWLNLGISFQPSELAKLAIVTWTAHLAVRKQSELRSLRTGMVPFLIIWAMLLVPILLQPDLSTAVVVAMGGALTLFAAGARIGHFVFIGCLASPAAFLVLVSGFRPDRWRAMVDPCANPDGAGYQVCQSLIAVGSGGITGVGFGEGRQKYGFLPEPHNDFIFSMIGEEWGMLGVTFLLALYMSVVLMGFRIGQRAPDLFGQLLAIGITSLIALHAVLHMAVGLGILPPTGLALPLVSYGRSNLLVTLMGIGILLSVARGNAAPGEVR